MTYSQDLEADPEKDTISPLGFYCPAPDEAEGGILSPFFRRITISSLRSPDVSLTSRSPLFREKHDMKLKPPPDTFTKWELYTPQQKEAILAEFRKKLPDDYFCKTTFSKFLKEKLGEGLN
jgi:hypothetical protein